MKNLTLNNIAKACGGILHNGEDIKYEEVSDVVIDSRKVSKGCLFIPIKGARVDGHDFIPEVFKSGALCVLSEHRLETSMPYIHVTSTLMALRDIAAYYRQCLNVKVIGITGSVGKTSTKEMIASVLGQKYSVLKTEGNFNNEIGLPLTLFRLNESHQVAVLEMGISHFGDMKVLAAIARPDICVITNIGLCHLENLIDRDGVLKAKTEMFDFLPADGKIVLNGDDDKLFSIKQYKDIKPSFYGTDDSFMVSGNNIAPLGLKGTFFTMKFKDGETVDIYIHVPGNHMVYNAMAAASVGRIMGMSYDDIKRGIDNIKTVKGRNHVIETGKFTIIDDCYNANPVSTKAALDVLSYGTGRKVAVLGDMFELGENETSMHSEIGEYAANKKIDFLICIGSLSRNTYDSAMDSGIKKAAYFETKEEFLDSASKLLNRGDNILVKASHGMEFTQIVTFIKDM